MFSPDYDLYSNLLPWSWIKNLCNFTHEYGISLPISPTQIDLQRECNLFLMEKFAHIGLMPRQLSNLNRCRLYLQIHNLSNIYNGHVSYFDKSYYYGHQDEFYQATHSWPDQLYPWIKEWQLWRKALRKFFTSDNKSTYLHKLSKWTYSCGENCTWLYHQ